MNTQSVKITNCDPSALGLFGLAMVTLVASFQKLGITEGVSMIVPWAIFLGSFAQLFACINDSKRNNIFGTTAFGAYAMFWFAIAFSWMIQLGVFGPEMAAQVDPKHLGVAYLGYLIFTLFMTIGAAETHKVLFIIFILIDFLFIGLTFDSFGIAKEQMHLLAGVSELGVSLFSFYGAAACVLNAHFGRIFLPVGKPLKIFKK
nr:acetate uptake transporter [Brevibacillus daliensis]